jgi:enterochelin esterase-like enzyme
MCIGLGISAIVSCSSRADIDIIATRIAPTNTPAIVQDSIPTPSVIPPTAASEVCLETEGKLEQTLYPSAVLQTEIPIHIYLPPCYESMGEHYPVLYALHGYPFDETHWQDLEVIQDLEEGLARGFWEPFIVVMPFLPEQLNVNTDGGPGSYEQELISGVMPFIEGNYRTKNDFTSRALAGVSRGGIWALEIGLRHGDLFGTMIVLSPALHVNRPRLDYDPFQLIKSSTVIPKHIFLSVGEDEGDFRAKTEEFVLELEANGIEHTFLLGAGIHADPTWIEIMPDVIRFITDTWH